MSISEIIINIAISLITGLLTFVISKKEESKGVPPLIYIKEIHKEIYYPSKASNSSNSSQRKQVKSENSSDNDFWIIIIGMLFAFMFITKIFAIYREDIIFWGWRVIVLTGTIVLTSFLYDVVRIRKFDLTKFLTLLSWVLAVFVFWVFNNPNIGPEYFHYLDAIKQGNKNAGLNEFSYFASYQFIGLLLLSMVLLVNLIQSLIIFSWPVAYNNALLIKIVYKGRALFNSYFIAVQFAFIIISYFLVSGNLIHFIFNNNNNFMHQIFNT